MERTEKALKKCPAAKGRKAALGEVHEGDMEAGAEDTPKPKAKAKAKAKSKAKGSPTKKGAPSGASEAGDVSENQASPKKRVGKGGDVFLRRRHPQRRGQTRVVMFLRRRHPQRRGHSSLVLPKLLRNVVLGWTCHWPN